RPSLLIPSPPSPTSTLSPYTTLFRSRSPPGRGRNGISRSCSPPKPPAAAPPPVSARCPPLNVITGIRCSPARRSTTRCAFLRSRSEEHTSELQSRFDLVCRLLLEKKN